MEEVEKMINEQEFIINVAQALGRNKPLTKAPQRKGLGPPAFWLEKNKYQDEKVELFKNNLEALTGRFVLVKNAEGVQNQLKEWLMELDAKEIICWDHPELKKAAQPEKLGVTVHYWNKNLSREQLKKIANTGTVALFAQPHQGRSVSLLPDTHIAVLKSSQIVPTMSSVIQKIQSLNEMPSCINFITGPSRSADIEMDLSIGVHGPYRIWVIVIDA
jgi:L-lactate dehydrogenase complex protein LldG